MQLAGIDHLRIEKKGAIDLVTQIDREVEQMFRALIARRFADHAVLAEEFERGGDRQNAAEYCWVFDPVDGTTNYAHGLPIFCCACSLERNASRSLPRFTIQAGGNCSPPSAAPAPG